MKKPFKKLYQFENDVAITQSLFVFGGFVFILYSLYFQSIFLLSTSIVIGLSAIIYRRFILYINTNQFTDGQQAAINTYNEDKKS